MPDTVNTDQSSPSPDAGDVDGSDVFMARTKSFTRRMRGMSPALARQFETVDTEYVVEVPRGAGKTTVADGFRLDAAAVFGRTAPLIVEVGPGRGEQIVHFAQAHPELDFLAFEVWRPGLARLAVSAASAGLPNIRVVEADAEQALKTILADGAAEEVWTFFPDPWRKARHRKRRIVSPSFAQTVARVLEDGGIWRLATDWEDYAEQMLEVVAAAPDFACPDEDDEGHPTFSPRFPGRVHTHFERRAEKAGRVSWDLMAVRLPRAD